MKEIKLPFGLRGDALIHISQAEPGIACGCVCPSCQSPLIARKGAIKVPHFAHQNGQPCHNAVGSALHRASKQLLSECREITLPPVNLHFRSYREPFPIASEATYQIDEVWEECRSESVLPDLFLRVGGNLLIIEIRVARVVDPKKLDKIRRLGISAIEVDLSSMLREFSPESLRNDLVKQTENKKWLYNAKADGYKRSLLQTGEKKVVINRGCALHVDHCPVDARIWQGKSYANVMDDCIHCEFCFDVSTDHDAIICGGLHKVSTLSQLRAFHKITDSVA
jgi:hypothetical protein